MPGAKFKSPPVPEAAAPAQRLTVPPVVTAAVVPPLSVMSPGVPEVDAPVKIDSAPELLAALPVVMDTEPPAYPLVAAAPPTITRLLPRPLFVDPTVKLIVPAAPLVA